MLAGSVPSARLHLARPARKRHRTGKTRGTVGTTQHRAWRSTGHSMAQGAEHGIALLPAGGAGSPAGAGCREAAGRCPQAARWPDRLHPHPRLGSPSGAGHYKATPGHQPRATQRPAAHPLPGPWDSPVTALGLQLGLQQHPLHIGMAGGEPRGLRLRAPGAAAQLHPGACRGRQPCTDPRPIRTPL